jgi:hypothetical protein
MEVSVLLDAQRYPRIDPRTGIDTVEKENIVMRLSVTREGVCVGDWIYWTLQITTTVSPSYTLQSSLLLQYT